MVPNHRTRRENCVFCQRTKEVYQCEIWSPFPTWLMSWVYNVNIAMCCTVVDLIVYAAVLGTDQLQTCEPLEEQTLASTEEAQFGGVERYELGLKAAHMPQ